MPWPQNIPQPTVTIVLPIERHRGQLLRAIDDWTTQTYPRENLDFVFVSNGRERRIEEQVKARLAQGNVLRGGLVYIKTDNEMAEYAFAARYARGEWILFTEPHCLPRPDCVSELIGTLLAQGMVGGCVRTLSDHSANRAARIEEQVYLDDVAIWSQASDWRKFTKRGFAIRRDVYQSIGGFECDFGWFSELIMAARLNAEGHRIGYVPSAALQHFNSTSIRELFDYVWDYRREMARYADVGSETLKPYFSAMCAGAAPPPSFVQQATRCAVRSALSHAMCRLHTRHGQRLATAILAAMTAALCGPAAKFALRYGLARVRLACSWSQTTAHRNYVHAANILGQWAEASYFPLLQRSPVAHRVGESELELFPGEITDGIYGFHARERYAGRTFRWASPVASLVFDALPGDYEIRLDAGGLSSLAHVQAFWNGHRAPRGAGGNLFHIAGESFVEGAPQVLTLISPPLGSRDPRETRALGLPLFSLTIARQSRAALRVAA